MTNADRESHNKIVQEAIAEDHFEMANRFLADLEHAHKMFEAYKSIIRERAERQETIKHDIFLSKDRFLVEREMWRAATSTCLFYFEAVTEEHRKRRAAMYEKLRGYGYGDESTRAAEEQADEVAAAVNTEKKDKATANLPPLCMVQLGAQYSPDDADLNKIRSNLKEEWEKVWGGFPPCPIFVLPPGMDCFYG